MSILRYTKLDYILTFFMLAVSGNPLFSNQWTNVISIFILILLFIIKTKRIRFEKSFLKLISFFVLLFILQMLRIKNVSISADINFIARLMLAYLFVQFMGIRFKGAFIRVMTFLAGISLIGFTINIFIGDLPGGIKVDRYCSWIVYNNIIDSLAPEGLRNSGMFWEPGAFQGYINLVFLFNLNRLKEFILENKPRFICLILALITTFSTTGYITFAFIFTTSILIKKESKWIKWFVVPLFCIGCYYAYYTFDFIGAKIEKQMMVAENLEKGEVSWSRSGAMIIDMYNIERHPIVGNGFLMDERYEGLGELMNGSGNGFSGTINMLGIPAMVLIMFLIGYRRKEYTILGRVVFVAGLIILLNGEYFINYAFIWTLLFLKPERNIHARNLNLQNIR